MANPLAPRSPYARATGRKRGKSVAFEVDILPVGDGGRSGDAIAIRYGDLGNAANQYVVVIDGGFRDDGHALVELITGHYHTTFVDLVVSTHPDADHVNGLAVVLDELAVGELWIHQPALSDLKAALQAESYVTKDMTKRNRVVALARSLECVTDLTDLARRKGITLVEPFAGVSFGDGALTVVGPTEPYYDSLVQDFSSFSRTGGILASLTKALRSVQESIFEESLGEDSETSPENNSSAVSLLNVDGQRMLFTGDAGAVALHKAADVMEMLGHPLCKFDFIQIPHHGSRRNVTPSVLDRLLGPKGRVASGHAFVSAAPDGRPKHPAKKVTNAFHRRGYLVAATCGQAILYRHDCPVRPGWGPVTYEPFHEYVED